MLNDRSAYFTVPDGTTLDPLNFTGLTVGSTYRMTFTVSGDVSGEFIFRPGGDAAANDTILDVEGDYDITFTVAAEPGHARFLHIDITGVSRVDVTAIYIYEQSGP